MTAKEDVRKCERCSHEWSAARPADSAGRGGVAAHEKWVRCPECGSIKVTTIGRRAQQAEPAPLRGDLTADTSGSATPAQDHNEPPSALKQFFKTHWRITIAIFSTLAVVVMPFAGESVEERVGGTLFYLVTAVIFWTLHRRHTRGSTSPAVASGSRSRNELDMTISDAWARKLSSCRGKASSFNEIAAATESDTVRSWLSSVTDDLDQQLRVANELAALGRSLEPGLEGSTPQHPAARETWSRLKAFESGLDDAITTAAEIRLNSLSPTTSLDTVRGQLAMLQSQLNTLDPG